MGRLAVWLLLGSVALMAAWACRIAVLTCVGQLLISEDSLEPVQVIVISHANAVEDALEAARLYREGYGAEVVVPGWEHHPLDQAIRDLGIPYFGEGIAAEILKRSGVPATAVHVLQEAADGTQTEVAEAATFATEHQLASLLFVTMRSHTARVHWLLRDALPATTRLMVRAPRTDRFSADSWWRSREDSREVFMEYMRWFNTVILHDPWGWQRPTGIPDGRASQRRFPTDASRRSIASAVEKSSRIKNRNLRCSDRRGGNSHDDRSQGQRRVGAGRGSAARYRRARSLAGQ